MGMEQMDMFSFVDNLNKDPITNTTCVVMDGECKDVAWKENIVPVCNETILKCVQEAQSENEKEITETKATFEVIVAAGKKKRGDKNGNYTIKSAQELESSKGKIIDLIKLKVFLHQMRD